MPVIRYQAVKLRASSLAIIERANEIIAEYSAEGFQLTLRQLFYQFVSRSYIPNRQTEYKRLGSIISDGRLAGLIDWNAIEDRGRNLMSHHSWTGPEAIVETCAKGFRIDPWIEQGEYMEVWVEKEALIGVIAVPCEKWRVPYFACKGYTSQSEIWSAGHYRLRQQARDGKNITIIHLGDHDPSGIDMTRDIEERLSMFAQRHVTVKRIALNMDQVEEWNPPPNPAKATDSRFEGYRAEYGDESWELDALDPKTIAGLIEEEIVERVDDDEWERSMEVERGHVAELQGIADRYDEVVQFLSE
jgi:hypothetical protein